MAQNLSETLALDQVVKLREQTQRISKFLFTRLKRHLDTLRPLIAPARVFGTHGRGIVREDVPGSEAALRKLSEQYLSICAKPFGLSADLGENAVADLDSRLELYPWEYTHEARDSNNELTSITISSPVRCVLAYKSPYTLSQIRATIAGKGDRRQGDIQEFLIAALAMQAVLEKFPGIADLLNDLKYDVRAQLCPGLGELPLTVINCGIPSFRPSDEIILATTRLSGVPAFIELIDVEAVKNLADPLKPQLEEMLRQ
jgi:hypothetical protein